MSTLYFKVVQLLQRTMVIMTIFALVLTMVPGEVFAVGETTVEIPPEIVLEESVNTSTTTVTVFEDTTIETATTTATTSVSNLSDGGSGETGTSTIDVPEIGTDTSTTTGNAGIDGLDGENGADATTPEIDVPEVVGEAIPVFTEELIGDVDGPEEEDVTGGVVRTGRNTLIETGMATAQGKLFTDANSVNVRSEFDIAEFSDLDTYTFEATGTNEAFIDNDGVIFSSTGDNTALATGKAEIKTGDAISAFNIANVVNSNIINSDGFIYLGNKILEDDQSLNLSGFLFPDEAATLALANTCSLLSCAAEDVVYNLSQTNQARLTNNATVEASTGENFADGDLALIETGDAYGGGNIINVVNTNIIDSNYRLLTFNAMGNLDGDLILPTKELINAFYSRPNGINQLEDVEDMHMVVENINEAVVDNNLDTYAETGLNKSKTTFGSEIVTGRGEAESNVLNKINENTFGGDSMYILIRIHGEWNGDVVGLPEGLSWEWTPDGIVIYNTDAEIAPSELLAYDRDSYSGNFTNHNNVVIENNVHINAVTGKNEIDGLIGNITTGNAFASANVMNIANTNVVGANWTLAIVNILGDFDGNVSFSQTDLSLTGVANNGIGLVGPGDALTYTYTITNNSDTAATNVTLTQLLESAYVNGTNTQQIISLGSLAPRASRSVTLNAVVNSNLAYGTTSIIAHAIVDSKEGDVMQADNLITLSLVALRSETNSQNTGGNSTTTTDQGNGTSGSGGSGGETSVSTGGGGSSSGGGGGGSSSKKKEVDRALGKANPNDPPLIVVTKKADIDNKYSLVTAGEEVDYTITVTNEGGNAYDAMVFDSLINPIGSVMNKQSWDLGTILPGEVITLTYTIAYNSFTPSGTYINTASVEAYASKLLKSSGGKPLEIDDAVHSITIKGVDLAVGNVEVLAYFPGADGLTSALVSWETSKPSLSRVFYGPKGAYSPYDATKNNYGYMYASFQFPTLKVKHLMILTGLVRGLEHSYRIDAKTDTYKTISRDYTFTVPSVVLALMLAQPSNTPLVAGVSVSKPVNSVVPQTSLAVPVPVIKQKVAPVSPAVSVAETKPPEPKVTPAPVLVPAKQEVSSGGGSIFNISKNPYFSPFRQW